MYMCVRARTFARACVYKTQHTTGADKYYATRQGLFFWKQTTVDSSVSVDNISHLHALLILYVDESNGENVNNETCEIETCTWVCLNFSILCKVVTVWRR